MKKILIFILLLSIPVFAANILGKDVIKKDGRYLTPDGKPYTGIFVGEFSDNGVNYTQTSNVKNGLKEGQTVVKGSDGTLRESNYKNDAETDMLLSRNGAKYRKYYFDGAENIIRMDYYNNDKVYLEADIKNNKAASGVCYNGNNKIQMTPQQIATLNAGKFTTDMCVAPISTTSALTIYNAFDGNEVAANREYKGKTLVIEGKVSRITSDLDDNPVIVIDADEYGFSGVRFYFSKSQIDAVSSVRKGQNIKIQGFCDGAMMGDVIIKSSKIID